MPICKLIDVPKREIIAESSSDQLLASSIAVKLLNFGLRLYFRPLAFHLQNIYIYLCKIVVFYSETLQIACGIPVQEPEEVIRKPGCEDCRGCKDC